MELNPAFFNEITGLESRANCKRHCRCKIIQTAGVKSNLEYYFANRCDLGQIHVQLIDFIPLKNECFRGILESAYLSICVCVLVSVKRLA